MSEAKYKKVASVVSSAGGTPIPVTDTLIELLKFVIDEEDLDFIMAFRRKRSQTMEQLLQSSKMSEAEILKKVEKLAKKGVVFNQPNRQGLMVYRLLPLFNVGIFEYMFMKKLEYTEENKKIASLFVKLFDDLSVFIQKNYDTVINILLKALPIDRTVPVLINKETGKEIIVNEELEVPIEQIVPTQKVEDLIKKFDDIAVGYCFCRHHKDMIGQPCEMNGPRENCFTFGKSARFTSSNGFSRLVSKEEALKIMKEAEEAGLIHKAYHPNFDVNKDETSICNCCKCCCGQSAQNLIGPTINATNFTSKINQELCVGCGTCVEHCHHEVIELNADGKAEKTGEYCIGCGVCAYFCPENAITLVEDKRIVRIPPPRRK